MAFHLGPDYISRLMLAFFTKNMPSHPHESLYLKLTSISAKAVRSHDDASHPINHHVTAELVRRVKSKMRDDSR